MGLVAPVVHQSLCKKCLRKIRLIVVLLLTEDTYCAVSIFDEIAGINNWIEVQSLWTPEAYLFATVANVESMEIQKI